LSRSILGGGKEGLVVMYRPNQHHEPLFPHYKSNPHTYPLRDCSLQILFVTFYLIYKTTPFLDLVFILTYQDANVRGGFIDQQTIWQLNERGGKRDTESASCSLFWIRIPSCRNSRTTRKFENL